MRRLSRSSFRRLFSRRTIALGISLVAIGCASTSPLTDAGYRVKIIGPLSPADAPLYQEVSVYECVVPDQSLAFDESCKNELRNHAAARGGAFVVIESRDQIFCVDSISSVSRPCGIRMISRVYRKKS